MKVTVVTFVIAEAPNLRNLAYACWRVMRTNVPVPSDSVFINKRYKLEI